MGSMRDEAARPAIPIPADRAGYLIATAARAPSVHNTQPWRFRIGEYAIDLHADVRRKLRMDPLGRELLISCGAALFGLRLAVRSLGYLPVVELLPDPAQLRLLARVRLGAAAPMTARERRMLDALPHRHTHRGPFAPGPLPAGLVPGLQHDALAEGAELILIDQAIAYQKLAGIADAVSRRREHDPMARAEMRRWSRDLGDPAHDGVPAHAFPAGTGHEPGQLPQRDFDLGRGLGLLPVSGPPPAATAVLITRGDGRADWLRAGQALHRLLAHAAGSWVFASLHTEPLEADVTRALIRERLALPGAPQMLLQLGLAHTAHATARRPPADLIEP
jgi:nitroreductase